MPSSSTLPNRKGIPLLRFPQLVRNEIYANWDIFEIYQFSTLSKVTKSIAKQMKKPNTCMSLEPLEEYDKVTLTSNRGEEGDKWFKFSICPSTEIWDKLMNDYFRRYVSYIYHPVFAENSVETFGSLVEHVQDIFEPDIEQVDFKCSSMDEEELKSYLHWLNGYEKLGNIQKLCVSIQGPAFKVILENWKVGVGIMDVRTETSEVCTVDFKVDHLRTSDCVKWVDFNVLRRFNCVEVPTDTNFSNEDMNMFLKDWKEGRSYQRVYCFDLGMCEREDHIIERIGWIF